MKKHREGYRVRGLSGISLLFPSWTERELETAKHCCWKMIQSAAAGAGSLIPVKVTATVPEQQAQPLHSLSLSLFPPTQCLPVPAWLPWKRVLKTWALPVVAGSPGTKAMPLAKSKEKAPLCPSRVLFLHLQSHHQGW